MRLTRLFSFMQACMVLTLVITMLGPAVCSLFDVEVSSVVIKDFAEEETEKKGDNEESEKEIILYHLEHAVASTHCYSDLHFQFYSENNSVFASEIILPPPEPTV